MAPIENKVSELHHYDIITQPFIIKDFIPSSLSEKSWD